MGPALKGRVLLPVLLVGAFSVSCARDPEVAKREYMQSGDRFRHEKKVKEAIVQYRNALKQDPRFGEARFKLAEAYVDDGDWRRAGREYIRAADLLPKDVDGAVEGGPRAAVRAPVPGRGDARPQCPRPRSAQRRRAGPARQRARRASGCRRRHRRDSGSHQARSEQRARLRQPRGARACGRSAGRTPKLRSRRRSRPIRKSTAGPSRTGELLLVQYTARPTPGGRWNARSRSRPTISSPIACWRSFTSRPAGRPTPSTI